MRKVDKTKKANIKCEHCKYWKGIKDWDGIRCTNLKSQRCGMIRDYWNRCKAFEWKDENDEK